MGKQNIYNKLISEIGNLYGVCGLMGNLQAESDFNPENMQNSCEAKLEMNDESYTSAVDNGTYADFTTDRIGYGLAQWTSSGRKTGLLEYAKRSGVSIGNEDMQIAYLIYELNTVYKNVMNTLKLATSVKEASDCVITKFERPKNQSKSALEKRQKNGEKLYREFASAETGGVKMSYTNSPLVTYKKISPNKTSPRDHIIDRFTPHVYVGQITAKRGVDGFSLAARKASCNYVIGFDGEKGLCVEEKDRSWCTSSKDNDSRAITVEIASETVAPYAITEQAYNALIDLAVDICKRNGKLKMLWLGSKEKTLAYEPKVDEMVITCHRWFSAKSCPGDYLYSRLGQISEEVTARLSGEINQDEPTNKVESTEKTRILYRVQLGAFSKKSNAENKLEAVKKKDFDAFVTFADGLYKVQVGAYSIKANAEAQLDRMKKAGFSDAFIKEFTIGEDKENALPEVEEVETTQEEFVRNVQAVLGVAENGIADGNLIDRTITVSQKVNKNHAIVTPLERYLKLLGYYLGEIEEDNGKNPSFGTGMKDAVKKFQKDNGCVSDGEITARNKTWHKLLGMN